MRIVYSLSDNSEICLEDQEYINSDWVYYRIEKLEDVIVAISEGAFIVGYSPLKRKYFLNTARIVSQYEDPEKGQLTEQTH